MNLYNEDFYQDEIDAASTLMIVYNEEIYEDEIEVLAPPPTLRPRCGRPVG